jgi:DNA-binding CsgD family transcriptional regulator
MFDGGADAFACYVHQNPLVSHFGRTGDSRALCISDFMTRRQLHTTELYDYVYREVGVEYQLAVTLPSPVHPAEMIGLTLSRGSRDFSIAERELLDLLGPHLRATLHRLSDGAMARAMLAAAEQDESCWIVLVSANGTVVRSTAASEAALELAPGRRVPHALRAWLAGERRASELDAEGHRVKVQLVANALPGVNALRLSPIDDLPDGAGLRALGLTDRQADVLALAVREHSSPRIAQTLGLSRRTVEKHFEGIYARLGVGNRAEAIVCALTDVGPAAPPASS